MFVKAFRFYVLPAIYVGGAALALQPDIVRAQDAPAVPVTVYKAKVEEIDKVINGIGTVDPLQSVTVRPRIDGQVTDIRFTEGQMIEKGSVLLTLDDRELSSALTSAKAKKAQDEAQWNSAKTEAQRYASLAEKGVASASTPFSMMMP